jgi:dihydrofolate synthase / folylpolyglutamate synthase
MRPLDDGPTADAVQLLFQRRAHGIKPRLDVIQQLLKELGHPEQKIRCVHVAGTNGKGSVCALLASILAAHGLKTGLYTSPHLIRFHERFQINGHAIEDDDLASIIHEVVTVADRIAATPEGRPATFFECATAMAFLYFHRQNVDIAVIETGMGGRWDATNIVNPLLSIITRIAMDHTEYLGPDLPTIAAEKAGIIKPARPVLIGAPPPEIAEVFEREAKTRGAPLVRAGDFVDITRKTQTLDGQNIRVETAARNYPSMMLPMVGRHQIENAALALAAVELLDQSSVIQCDEAAVRTGVEQCRWAGRMQCLRREPDVLLDVAHNPDGARALVYALKELAGHRPWGLITGLLRDKDALGFFKEFKGRVQICWTMTIQDERGLVAEEVSDLARRAGLDQIQASSWDEAWPQAMKWARDNNGLVIIAGSLYLAGEALHRIEKGWMA